jgi:hypothetical protein
MFDEMEKKNDRHDKQFIEVFDAIRSLMAQPEPMKRQIGFKAGKKGWENICR